MSTQNRNSGGGGGGRNQKKSNSGSGGGGGDSATQSSIKKTDASKTEKEKIHPKPTAEQLRIAQITNSNTLEDPQMREKVATLIEMTQRSEEEVCCALYECDNNLERAVEFLLEKLPVGAFETSSKKKKNKAASTGQENAAGDGEWADSNANTDKREKSRNRSSNRGGRGGTDSRGWRGREARENERNLRESRGGDDRTNDNYRGGPRGSGRDGGGGRTGSGRGGGYISRGGRGGGRMGGGGRGIGGRGERGGGGYASRNNASEDHQEVELWDNTIAQNAEKQQHQHQDDAWGDWDNEEYVGSLKDSKVFTTSNLPNQTAASVVSGGGAGAGGGGGSSELSAPPGLEHHLGTSVLGGSTSQQQGSHLNALVGSAVGAGSTLVDDNTSTPTGVQSSSATTPMMQYSAAVSSTQMSQQPSVPAAGGSSSLVSSNGASLNATQYNSSADTFSNAATAAANLVQQVQQQQQQPTAKLSPEQSQYFNSLTQGTAVSSVQQQQLATYAQNTPVQYPTSYANVFGSTAANNVTGGVVTGGDQTQLSVGQQPQVRRARAKLPPPSKIPATAVEMPGDTLNNIGYLDVQFGGLDFGPDDSFDTVPEKFNASVSIDSQQQQQQLVQSPQDVANQSKSSVQQQQSALTAGLQNSQIGDSLSAGGYSQRAATQQQVVSGGGSGGSSSVGTGSNALDQLTKNDPYNQSNASNASAYQSAYQSNAAANKAAVAYQQSAAAQGYNSSSYANVQSSVANTYQPSYSAYQQSAVNSYQQQQQAGSGQNVANSVAGSNVSGSGSATQNIPGVGGSSSNNSATANSNAGYLSSGYPSQQSAYQSSQSVYGGTGLSNNAGFAGSTNNSSQYSNFSTSAKLKDTSAASSGSHYDSVTSSNAVSSSGTAVSSVSSSSNSASAANSMSPTSATAFGVVFKNSNLTNSSSAANNSNVNNSSSVVANSVSSNNNNSSGNSSGGGGVGSVGVSSSSGSNNASSVVAAAAAVSSSSNKNSAGGMVPTNIQMVSQYIQTGLPYYQQPVYSYEDLQMMQQRVPHVQGYYDLNYTPTSLGTGRDNLGSVAYSTMTDGRFARTDNNSSPVSNVSSTMSQQAGSSGPMLNVPYYFYSGNVMPGGFQYGTPAIYPQQIPAANTASGGQFQKPSYNTAYGSTSYDALSQASQDYTKGAYPSSVNQQAKSQNVTNPQQAGTGSDITSSMYGKGHVALNKVNSYEKQNFHSGTPPPFNMPNTQTAGGTSAQPYGMYLPMPAAGHHNMIHQPIHQMDGRIHNSSRRDSNSTGQRQQTSSQSKSATKQGYSPSYWTGQN